jgi:exodeoxyribonuclease VII small subunit
MTKDRSIAPVPKDIAALSFEEALEALKQLVASLERGDISLEDSISAYERGAHLRNHCAKLLEVAQAKIERIRLSADGLPEGSEPFDDAPF